MKERPVCVTVGAGIIMGMAGFTLGSITLRILIASDKVREIVGESPIPIPVQYAKAYLSLIIMIVCAAAMLKGHKWGRTVYVAWTLVMCVINLATRPARVMLIPGLIVYAVTVFFLFRPAANAHFSSADAGHDS